METFTINHAKTHLSRQIEKAAKAEAFIIAKAPASRWSTSSCSMRQRAAPPRRQPDRIHEGPERSERRLPTAPIKALPLKCFSPPVRRQRDLDH